MDDLEELLARERIRQLVVRYAVAVDAKDLDTLATLFPDDVNNGRYGSGPEGVKRHFDNVLRRFHCSMHMIGNHRIDFDGDDRAHGLLYCRAQHHVLDPEHWWDMALAVLGHLRASGGQLAVPAPEGGPVVHPAGWAPDREDGAVGP